MVNSDWHDGYEEQGEECIEWMASCGAVVESALRVGVAFGCGHELGHAALTCAAACLPVGTPAAHLLHTCCTLASAVESRPDPTRAFHSTGTSPTRGRRSRRFPSGATLEMRSRRARGKRARRSASSSARTTPPSTPVPRRSHSARSRGRCCLARPPPRPPSVRAAFDSAPFLRTFPPHPSSTPFLRTLALHPSPAPFLRTRSTPAPRPVTRTPSPARFPLHPRHLGTSAPRHLGRRRRAPTHDQGRCRPWRVRAAHGVARGRCRPPPQA